MSAILCGPLVCPTENTPWEAKRFVCAGVRPYCGDGTLAGSTTNLHQELRNLLRFGIPLAQAVKAMTLNPAVQLGADKTTGSIQPGKYADLVVLDQDYEIFMVLVKGKIRWCGNRLLLNAHDDGGAACLQGKYDLNQTGDFLPLALP